MFKKVKSIFHRSDSRNISPVVERSIVLHQDQIKQELYQHREMQVPIPAEEMLKEDQSNKEFFAAHPLAKGFGML